MLKNYPVIKIAFAFILGIIFQNYFSLPFITAIFSTTLFLILLIAAALLKIKTIENISSYILAILMGISSLSIADMHQTLYPFEEAVIKQSKFFGEVKDCDLLTKEKLNFILEIDSVHSKDKKYVGKFLTRVTLRDKSKRSISRFYDQLKIGNYISLEGTIREPRNQRNPGEFDYKQYLLTKDIVAIVSCSAVKKIEILDTGDNLFKNLVFTIRKDLADIIQEYNDEKVSAFLKGLLLADRSDIDENTKENFINAGVVHVLAVSGLHVGYIVLIFVFMFSRFNLKLRLTLTILGLLSFMLITGAHASVFRATVMAIILLLAKYSGRRNNNYNSLALASIIILLFDPKEIFNPGFQLSFSAVMAIISITPIFQRKIYSYKTQSKVLKWILLFFAVSLSAQIGTLPFTLIYFHKFSIIALIANLIVIPLIGFIVAVGIFTIFLSFISSWAASVYALSNLLFVDIVSAATDIIGHWEYSFIYIPSFSIYDSSLFYFLLVLLFWGFPQFHTFKSKIILLLLISLNAAVLFSIDNDELFPENKLTVAAIDIGQGDSFFIKFPNGKTALIDAGNATQYFDNGSKVIEPFLKSNEISKINYAFISHVDADHYKGIYSLIEMDLIDTVYKPALDTTLNKDVRFEQFLNANEVPIVYYKKGIKDIGNCRLYILNEVENHEYQNLDVNNKSGIIKLVHGKNSFLFIGDAEAEMEELLCETYGSFLNCDVLKVSHHGSKTGSTEDFIEFTKPDIGIISAGIGNKFGHPAEEIIERLLRHDVKIKRTDFEGAVIISSDGNKIEAIDWRN